MSWLGVSTTSSIWISGKGRFGSDCSSSSCSVSGSIESPGYLGIEFKIFLEFFSALTSLLTLFSTLGVSKVQEGVYIPIKPNTNIRKVSGFLKVHKFPLEPN